jgi:hypothetical protein
MKFSACIVLAAAAAVATSLPYSQAFVVTTSPPFQVGTKQSSAITSAADAAPAARLNMVAAQVVQNGEAAKVKRTRQVRCKLCMLSIIVRLERERERLRENVLFRVKN